MSDDARKGFLSRRRFFKTTAALVAGTGATGMIGTKQALAAKVGKQEAHYRNHPRGEQRCFVCKHYFLGHCEIVTGRVSANGWCRFFAPSASADHSGM